MASSGTSGPSVNPVTAAEKKRIRDRRAQQNLRDKRNRYIASLLGQIEYCHKNHGEQERPQQDIQELQDKCRNLKRDNDDLRQRLQHLCQLLNSWTADDSSTTYTVPLAALEHPDEQLVDRIDMEILPCQTTPRTHPRHQIPATYPVTQHFTPSSPSNAPQPIGKTVCRPRRSSSTDETDGSMSPSSVDFITEPERSNWLPEMSLLPEDQHGAAVVLDPTSGLDSCNSTTTTQQHAETFTNLGACSAQQPYCPLESPTMIKNSTPLHNPFIQFLCQVLGQADTSEPVLETPHEDAAPTTVPQASDTLAALPPWVMKAVLGQSNIPAWSLTPYCNDHAGPPRPDITPWSRRADLAKASPDVVSPLDLLFGSKQNAFAASIQRTLRQFHCRDPERLAIGWLLYNFSKWRAEPTLERYMRLPEEMRPVVEQLQMPHPSYLDMILWKRLRVNLLRKYQKLDLDRVLGLLSCCLKVRWPWGEDILEPGNDGELHIRPQFFEVFTQVEGWGLTSEFVQAYPDLVEGLDLSSIVYKVV